MIDPLSIATIAKGIGSLFGHSSKKKQNNAADAYANTVGQNDVNYANAQTAYNTGIQNQQSQQDERSRSARAALKSSLLRSIGPNIIGQEALPALERNAVYNPIDYSGAPQRVFTPRPSSNTGGFTSALSSLFDTIAQGQIGRSQANDYQQELDNYRFALQNPGVQRLPAPPPSVNYYAALKKVFG